VQAPAAFVAAGVGVLIFAVRAAWTPAAWACIAAFVTVGQLGELLDLPGQIVGLSPFTHTPAMPVGHFEAFPVAVLTATGAAVLATAWWRYRTRDVG